MRPAPLRPAVRVKRNSLHLPPWTWITPPPASAAAALQQREHAEQQQQTQQQGQQPAAPAAAAGPAIPAASGVAGAAGGSPPAAKGAVRALLGEGGRPDVELMERVSAYPATKSWGRADTAPKVCGWAGRPWGGWLARALWLRASPLACGGVWSRVVGAALFDWPSCTAWPETAA